MKFIRYFIYEWKKHPRYMAFMENMKKRKPKKFREYERSNRARGIKPYKNRFDFAFRNAKILYAHRDKYGRK